MICGVCSTCQFQLWNALPDGSWLKVTQLEPREGYVWSADHYNLMRQLENQLQQLHDFDKRRTKL